MWRLLKWLLILGVIAAIGLIAYAYLGPIFGSDFSAPQEEVSEPVILDAD